jgi:hypothetical protein
MTSRSDPSGSMRPAFPSGRAGFLFDATQRLTIFQKYRVSAPKFNVSATAPAIEIHLSKSADFWQHQCTSGITYTGNFSAIQI